MDIHETNFYVIILRDLVMVDVGGEGVHSLSNRYFLYFSLKVFREEDIRISKGILFQVCTPL